MKVGDKKNKFALPDGWIRDSSVPGQMTFTYIGEHQCDIFKQSPFILGDETELSREKLEESEEDK